MSLPALLLQQNNHTMDPELVQGMLVLLELLHTLEIKKKINFKSMIQLTVTKLQCLYLRINLCFYIHTVQKSQTEKEIP